MRGFDVLPKGELVIFKLGLISTAFAGSRTDFFSIKKKIQFLHCINLKQYILLHEKIWGFNKQKWCFMKQICFTNSIWTFPHGRIHRRSFFFFYCRKLHLESVSSPCASLFHNPILLEYGRNRAKKYGSFSSNIMAVNLVCLHYIYGLHMGSLFPCLNWIFCHLKSQKLQYFQNNTWQSCATFILFFFKS